MGWPRVHTCRDYNTILQLALFQKQWKHSLTFNILPHATCLLQPRHAVAGMQGKQSEHHANGLHFPSTTKKISQWVCFLLIAFQTLYWSAVCYYNKIARVINLQSQFGAYGSRRFIVQDGRFPLPWASGKASYHDGSRSQN